MDLEKQFEIAAGAVAQLEHLHQAFMSEVAASRQPKINGAEVRVVDGELQVECLGVDLKARRRFVAVNGFFTAIEYGLIATHENESICVATFHLQGRTEDLTSDYGGTEKICHRSNAYLAHRLAPWVCAQLMESVAFSPRPSNA